MIQQYRGIGKQDGNFRFGTIPADGEKIQQILRLLHHLLHSGKRFRLHRIRIQEPETGRMLVSRIAPESCPFVKMGNGMSRGQFPPENGFERPCTVPFPGAVCFQIDQQFVPRKSTVECLPDQGFLQFVGRGRHILERDSLLRVLQIAERVVSRSRRDDAQGLIHAVKIEVATVDSVHVSSEVLHDNAERARILLFHPLMQFCVCLGGLFLFHFGVFHLCGNREIFLVFREFCRIAEGGVLSFPRGVHGFRGSEFFLKSFFEPFPVRIGIILIAVFRDDAVGKR